jgi:hypothetical protein
VESPVAANADRGQRLVETSRVFVDARPWDRQEVGDLLGGEKGLVQGNGDGVEGSGFRVGVHACSGANGTWFRLNLITTCSAAARPAARGLPGPE